MNGERAVVHVPAFEDLVDRVTRFDSFVIAGRVYSSDMLIPQLLIDAKDLIAEAASCGAFSLYWGVEAARARRFKEQVMSAYRSWRDRVFLEIKSKPIGETAKGESKFPTDSVVEKTYRTFPDYGEWQKRVQDSQESAELAEALCESFRLKGEMIKVQERLLRDEAGGPYVVSENMRQTISRQPQMESTNVRPESE